MPARQCAGCGAELPLPKSSGRPRTKCETCSPTRARDARRRAPQKLAGVTSIDLPQHPPSLVDATRAQLEAAGRLDSVAGQAALILAAQLVGGQHSGAGFAALAKGLREAMGEAMDGAAVADDPLDELKRLRDLKLGRA